MLTIVEFVPHLIQKPFCCFFQKFIMQINWGISLYTADSVFNLVLQIIDVGIGLLNLHTGEKPLLSVIVAGNICSNRLYFAVKPHVNLSSSIFICGVAILVQEGRFSIPINPQLLVNSLIIVYHIVCNTVYVEDSIQWNHHNVTFLHLIQETPQIVTVTRVTPTFEYLFKRFPIRN